MFPQYEYRNSAIYIRARDGLSGCPARFHKHLETMYVKSGQLQVSIEGVAYTLNPGDVYVVFPNVIHAIQETDAQVVVAIVDFELYQAFHELLIHNVPQPPVLRKGEFSQTVYEIFDRMGALVQQEILYKQSILQGYANALLGELLGHMQLCKRNVDNGLLQQLIFYFLDNYTREITLEDAAQALNYSKFYISRVVTNTFGCNFRSLVNSYRVSMAQNLLVSSGKTISEIAYACGFRNQSSFNRIFLKHTGITPTAYRKKMGPPPQKPTLFVR
jgi:AraC-like DNA-binding protein/mannose-6-phosphate isomerase-like protein (cupin superfamily)